MNQILFSIAAVCYDHIAGAKSQNQISPDFIPSVFAHVSSPRKRQRKPALDTFHRSTDIKRRRRENTKKAEAAQTLLDLSLPTDVEVDVLPAQTADQPGTQCQTDVSGKYIDSLVDDCQSLRKEVAAFKESNRHMLESALEDETKVKFYTGLPSFAVLMTIVNLIVPHLKQYKVNLTPFQMIVLTLMRLRLNLPIQDLAYRFDVSVSTISRVFRNVVNVMYVRLVPLSVIWPDRDVIFKTMPMSFRNKYKHCVSIIDCFEIFIERPSDLVARAQTWSNYKSHNTIKYLISITPQGVISFISKGWGGRVSDKELTQNSLFLSKLLPGDVVLADRGFNIHELLALQGAHLEIPAFTRGLAQLPAAEVEKTRQIANVRIHIERVIGLTRNKYTMLQDKIPITLLQKDDQAVPTIDKIVHVCCALVNLSSSVVPSQ